MIDVGERCGRQRVDVVGERPLVELVAHDRRHPRAAEHLGRIADRAANERERVGSLRVDIQREQFTHRRRDVTASALTRVSSRVHQLGRRVSALPVPPPAFDAPDHPARNRRLDGISEHPTMLGEVGVRLHHGNAATMPERIEPGPGQESVWDYPRPPALEPVESRLRVEFNGVTIADTTNGYRVLETSQPPAYYFPPDDVAMEHLVATPHRTFCEWKGQAHYYTVVVNRDEAIDAVWSYGDPIERFAMIKGHLAFYPQRMSACYVDDERVQANEGGFYGGWITSKIVGPFKGGAGSAGW